MKSLPEKESEWSALHHLQHCCTNAKEFSVDEDKGVTFVNKNLTFPFDELTNFQVSKLENGPINKEGLWNSSGPFYTIGTVAYFMKCLGLKHIHYIR